MKLYIRDVGDFNFITTLPIIYLRCVKDKLNKNKNKPIIKYLNETYELNINDILDLIRNNISISKENSLYVIYINPNIKESKSDLSIEALIRLIDYGTLDVKGIYLFEKVSKYIKENIRNIYNLYMIKKGDSNGN